MSFLMEKSCTFGGVAMPTLLKPNFITPRQSLLLKDSVELMSKALTKFIELYLKNSQVREIMGFSEREEELFRIDPGYANPLVVSRLDAFMTGDSLKFLEFNCDSPAGIAYSDILEDGFKLLFRDFAFLEKYHIQYARRQDMLLTALLGCYREFRSTHQNLPEKPVVAIVDWADVSTLSEFELHRRHFADNGVHSVIVTPQDFSIQNGRVLAAGEEVHLIYKRVITRELIARWEDVGNFVEAIREGLVCCCNSFRSFIVGNKKILSLITDPRFGGIFNEKEKELIKNTVPWTRILTDSTVEHFGRLVLLKTFIPQNKDRLVLKPCNMYGGKDVYIGMGTSQAVWEEVMEKHIGGGDWVVQEFINIPTDLFPGSSGRTKYVNINPFLLGGKFSGAITRVSDSPVINISAGGGLVPTLTIE
jgi:uncharacterized circularly permuted ATP-grasp superfamily protein